MEEKNKFNFSSTFQLMENTNGEKYELIVNYVKGILVVLTICTTLTLFSLPIIFYYITSYTDYFAVEQNQTLGNMTSGNNQTQLLCDSIAELWGHVDAMESDVSEIYQSNMVCSPYLRDWQQCLSSNESTELQIVPTDKTIGQGEIEERILELKKLLDFFDSNCSKSAIPFLCHYYFPIIDNLTLILPTNEECLYIEKNVCQTIISLSENRRVEIPIALPECSTLPEGNGSFGSLPSNIICKDDFLLNGSKCVPRCDRFEASPHYVVRIRLFSEVFAAALGTTVGFICIILSIYNRKIMFKFPSIFMFYLFVDVFITGIPFLIVAFDRSSLLCSSVNLIQASDNPTTFCLITGAIWQYITVNFTMWWFFHLCVFFYMIMCPFHAKRMMKLKRTTYITIALTILGIVFPLPAVVVTWALGYYRLGDFPPTLCMTDSTLWFYSANIVICPLLGIGTSMLIMVFWKVHKKQFTRAKLNGEEKKLTTAEKKLIFASVCYIIFGAIAMLYFSVANGDQAKAIAEIIKYFNCESTGYVPGKCDRSGFERYIHTELQTFANLSLGFLSFGILNFVVSWRKLWKSIKNQFKRILKGDNINPSSPALNNKNKPQFTPNNKESP